MSQQLSLTFAKHYALLSPDEIYEAVDQSLLTRLAEDRRLERKPPGVHGQALGPWFSMWANTLPEGGLIVVGIEDKGKFTGCHKLSAEQLNKLEKSHYVTRQMRGLRASEANEPPSDRVCVMCSKCAELSGDTRSFDERVIYPTIASLALRRAISRSQPQGSPVGH